ncbi:MAG TPA: VOC family protein [Candidatus Acidoferrales bacterium]|nr:VOC family protein [Candidatus Acidoferrales bacterium]
MQPEESKSKAMRAVDAQGEPVALGEFNGFEVYPMPMFATLSVAEVAAVAKWYEEALGFRIMFQGPAIGGQHSLVHLRRAKYQDLLLVPITSNTANQAPASMTLSFQAEDVDALAGRARAAASLGVSAIEGPIDTPWNTRDLRVTDPAGHRLVFTTRQTNPDPAQFERVKKMFDAAGKTGRSSE